MFTAVMALAIHRDRERLYADPRFQREQVARAEARALARSHKAKKK